MRRAFRIFYRGQTTNVRTASSGCAPVFTETPALAAALDGTDGAASA